MQFSELPTDVLREIFLLCDPGIVAQTCRDFAAIVYGTPSFWCHVKLGFHQFVWQKESAFLCSRLQRAKTHPLTVIISTIFTQALSVSTLCSTLSTFNQCIAHLRINTATPGMAVTVLAFIFPVVSEKFPNLHTLAFQVDDSPEQAGISSLGQWLDRTGERFPMLQTLILPSFHDCMPMAPERGSYTSLCTLILDGTTAVPRIEILISVARVLALLQNSPRLETLWFKHTAREPDPFILLVSHGSHESSSQNNSGDGVHVPVSLPHLIRLAVSVPGGASDLLSCIKAPGLQDLHLDGSRGPFEYFGWTFVEENSVVNNLKHLALGSSSIRRLAITAVYFTQESWRWIFFGDTRGAPFPHLESISLRGIESGPDSPAGEIRSTGFDNDLLLRHSREPHIPLRRLSFAWCSFPLSGSAVLRALKIAGYGGGHETSCLEYCPFTPQFSQDDWETLEKRSGQVIPRPTRPVEEDNWWIRDCPIDGSDSHAY